MAEINLKEYTTRAKELEVAIYTQKELMREYEKVITQKIPKKPVQKKVDMAKPIKPDLSAYTFQAKYRSQMISGFGMLILCFIMFCLWIANDFDIFFIGLALVPGFLAGFYLKYSFETKLSNTERAETGELEYKKAVVEYERLLNQYNSTIAKEETQFRASCEEYEVRCAEYKETKQTMDNKHNAALHDLENALQELYAKNIIFTKYRNMVAITMINEYLESGRCSTLEGSDGAYNLYEMELRQNIVINQLSNIVSNLESIKNNQFSLYRELVNTKVTVNNILSEIREVNENTRLTAYFAGVTAIIEASPKIYHTVSF